MIRSVQFAVAEFPDLLGGFLPEAAVIAEIPLQFEVGPVVEGVSDRPAKDLFHNHAEKMPVVDYHCHINPAEIAEDKRYGL